MVIDADGLYIITKNLDLVKGYKHVILTPNKNEYARLASELQIDLEDPSTSDQVLAGYSIVLVACNTIGAFDDPPSDPAAILSYINRFTA